MQTFVGGPRPTHIGAALRPKVLMSSCKDQECAACAILYKARGISRSVTALRMAASGFMIAAY